MKSRLIVIALFHLLYLSIGSFSIAQNVTSSQTPDSKKPMRIGIIGLDTSHVPAFTKLFNKPDATGDLAKLEVVAAYPGGSPDIESSRSRVEGFTKQLRDMNVEICDSIDVLVTKVDAVLLESVDGRPHLEQALPVIKAGLPLFIDKPLAGSLADCIAIQKAAKEKNVRWFSSSSLRFSPSIIKYRTDETWKGKVVGAIAWSPSPMEATHPDLFWYGVHGVESLYTVMGPGCQQVTRTFQQGTDVVTGTWKDGRTGTFRGIRDGKSDYGLVVFGKEKIEVGGKYDGYAPLVDQIGAFFLGATSPVDSDETIELFAFMQAAQISREKGGIPVSIDDVMKQASLEADKRLAALRK